MENESFTPVKSYIDTPSIGATVLISSIVCLWAIQLLLAVKLLPIYFWMVDVGVTNKYGLWTTIFSEVLLLVAVILLVVKKQGGQLFFIAGLSFLLGLFVVGNVFLPSLLAHSIFILAAASSILGWLAARPKLITRASDHLENDEATRKIYWSYKSLPELKGVESSKAKQLYKKASIEGNRRAPYWKHMLFAGLTVGTGIALLGEVGLLIGSAIYAAWFTQNGVARARAVLREMGYPKNPVRNEI